MATEAIPWMDAGVDGERKARAVGMTQSARSAKCRGSMYRPSIWIFSVADCRYGEIWRPVLSPVSVSARAMSAATVPLPDVPVT